jgi:hypothetical protein
MQLKYVLVVPNGFDEEEGTLFQGWNPSVRNPDFLSLIFLLSALPAAPEEIFLSHDELIKFRTSGVQRNVTSAGSSFLSDLDFGAPDEIVVFLALGENVNSVKEHQIREEKKTILLSFSDDPIAIDIRKRKKSPHQFIDDEILFLLPESHVEGKILRGTYDAIISFSKNHGVNAPNMTVLQSLGFNVEEKKREVNRSFQEAEDLVIESAKIVRQCVAGAGSNNRETILYSPSVKTFFYDFKNIMWNQILRNVPEKWKRKIIEATFRNPGYSEFLLKIDEEPTNPYSDEILGPILSDRQSELYATTASIALMASNESLVSIRLPNAVNLQGARLRNLESLAKRSDEKASHLLQREFRNFIVELKQSIGPKILDLIRSGGSACKLCTDVPLEWLHLNDLPLMISHEVSKIPMTPGNTQLQYASHGERIGIKDADCKRILVVRSFADRDPLLKVFENYLEEFELKERLNIRIVDVNDGEEAKSALNEFDGFIVVFDCHGDHGGNDSYGWLQFGNEKVNTWELAYQARIPPIVLLSACSTSAIGGSHVSVSSGLLRSGARSVLGTFLPVDGPRSALFMVRILNRLDTFLPAVKKMGFKGITWRSFVHSVMQIQYLTDVLVYFRNDLKIIDDAIFMEVETEALPNISVGDPSWFDTALKAISVATALSKEEIITKICEDHPLMETLRYCQVGLPDCIGIVFDEE